jgi:hypothetical protein
VGFAKKIFCGKLAVFAKMAKFGEKSRFLWGFAAENGRKRVREWLKNATEKSLSGRVFQKVTIGVSLVKQSVRQNEMGA